MSSFFVIRKKSTPHCARGPATCDKCKAAAEVKKIALLEVYYEKGNQNRTVIEVVVDGESKYLEFDHIKYFKDEAEAKEYAEKNGITDIIL